MLDRCYTPTCANYHNYGGRGITVCDRWREGGFKVFISDMGPRPTPQHSIDRVDNNKGYSPENCRWATKKEQARNMRTNRLLTHNGVTATVAEWAEKLGVTITCITDRLDKLGMTVEEAVTTPKRKNGYG